MTQLNTIRTQLCDQTKWTRLEGQQLTSFDKPKTILEWIRNFLGFTPKATFTELNQHIISSLNEDAQPEDVQAIKLRLQDMDRKTTTQKGALSGAIETLQTWETDRAAKVAATQEKAARLAATNAFLTALGKNWDWLKEVATPADYLKFESGELQLVRVEDPNDPQKRAISADSLRKNRGQVAVRKADFLDDKRLPPAAKTGDPYAMSNESLKQWNTLLEKGLSYSDLKNSDIPTSFLKMTGTLDYQRMEECKTLCEALKELSAEERARITGDKTLLKERVTAYENQVALRKIYKEVYPDENDFERMTKDALNRMFKPTVVDDIFNGKNFFATQSEGQFKGHLLAQKQCAEKVIKNEANLQKLYLKFHSEFDGIAFREWSQRVLNQYRAGLGDQALNGEVEIDLGTLANLERMLTPTEEDLAAIQRAERLLKWIEVGNDPAEFPE